MAIFYTETIQGDLILIKTNIPTPPACPVIARSVTPPAPWLIRFVLCLIALFAPLVAPLSLLWMANKIRFTVLAIVAMSLVEVIAQNHVNKCLGVIA